jgi:hypothetical protein
MRPWRRALGPTLYGVMGNVIGLTLVLELNYHVLRAPRPLLILILTLASYLVAWLGFRGVLRVRTLGERYGVSLRRTVWSELASTVLVLAGVFSVLVVIPERWLPGFAENSPFFALFVLAGAAVGALLVYPLRAWLVRRGRIEWPGGTPAGDG